MKTTTKTADGKTIKAGSKVYEVRLYEGKWYVSKYQRTVFDVRKLVPKSKYRLVRLVEEFSAMLEGAGDNRFYACEKAAKAEVERRNKATPKRKKK